MMACSPGCISCGRIALRAIMIIGFAFTLLCCGMLVLLGIGVSDCDLSCNEGTHGAELQTEGYYECDGDMGCGPVTPVFWFMLYLTLSLLSICMASLGFYVWRRHRRRSSAKTEAEREAALTANGNTAGLLLESHDRVAHSDAAGATPASGVLLAAASAHAQPAVDVQTTVCLVDEA
eukprot:jgi/Ulvmu1/11451/UM076_0026.1